MADGVLDLVLAGIELFDIDPGGPFGDEVITIGAAEDVGGGGTGHYHIAFGYDAGLGYLVVDEEVAIVGGTRQGLSMPIWVEVFWSVALDVVGGRGRRAEGFLVHGRVHHYFPALLGISIAYLSALSCRFCLESTSLHLAGEAGLEVLAHDVTFCHGLGH